MTGKKKEKIKKRKKRLGVAKGVGGKGTLCLKVQSCIQNLLACSLPLHPFHRELW